MTSRSGHGSTTVCISEDWPLSVTEGGHFFVTSITPKMTTANNVRSSKTSVSVIRHHLPSICFRVGGLSRSPLLDHMIAWGYPYCQDLFSLFFKNIFPAFFPAFYFQKNCILIVTLCLPEIAWWRAFVVLGVHLVR